MKVILKNNQEIEVTNANINYNAYLADDDSRSSISFTIEDDSVTVESLVEMLTKENLASIQIVSESKTITKENVKLSNIIENISDSRHNIEVRATL